MAILFLKLFLNKKETKTNKKCYIYRKKWYCYCSYQAPGSFDEFWKDVIQKDKARSSLGQKGKHGLRNIYFDGTKELSNDGSRSKTDNNYDNSKRKLKNQNKGRGRYRGKKEGDRPGPDRSVADIS
jgi:hypothetical protein